MIAVVFMDARGNRLELLNDDSAFEFDDLGFLAEPIKRAQFVVVPAQFQPVVIRGFQRGGIFGPFAANADRIEF